MKARVSNLIKTEAEWSKLTFTPLAGELIVYAPDANFKYARLKIGDGMNTVQALPFVVDPVVAAMLSDYDSAEVTDAGRITDYFK